MAKIVFATRNEGKVAEMAAILQETLHLEGDRLEILSLKDFPEFPEIEEDGATFEENAIKKARETARITGEIAIADDSGLEVDALGGRPGVFSARFAGPKATDAENNKKLLRLMEKTEWRDRKARFRCVIALATPGGSVETVHGTCEGMIDYMPKGSNGFGYDPLFFVPEYGKTFGELEAEVKNRISHRARALRKAGDLLRRMLLL